MSEENQTQDMPQQQAPAEAPRAGSFYSVWKQINPAARMLSVLFGLSLISALWLAYFTASQKTPLPLPAEDAASTPLLRVGKEGIGWVSVKGVITDSERWDRRSSEQISRRIRELGDKKNVKAIVLDINSPGGSVGAVQDIYSTILSVRDEKKKPFIALFRDVSASGGYYIAAACDKIVAYPGTLTGSIGVIMQLTSFQGLTQKIGMKAETIKSGNFKDIGSPFRDMSQEERQLLQNVISDTYAQFYEAVKAGRKMNDERLAKLADGRIFSGRQAFEAGLIDGVGGRKQAIELAAELGKLPKDAPIISDSADKWQEFLTMLDGKLNLRLPGLNYEQISGPAYIWRY
ncbi:MAG TPA: signal peptide peptidase SppA [Elusimicrobiales bacterium]|nr:signal peptide peptidase SppA [Elusimicrobiales bacterium]